MAGRSADHLKTIQAGLLAQALIGLTLLERADTHDGQ
jgi:hypothetical protein